MGKGVKLEVAMVKMACPLCGIPEDVVAMNSKLTEKAAKEVKEAEGEVIGEMEEVCDQCKEYQKQGIVFVGINHVEEGFLRSGHISVVEEEDIKKVIKQAEKFGDEKTLEYFTSALKERGGFMEFEAGLGFGIFEEGGEDEEE